MGAATQPASLTDLRTALLNSMQDVTGVTAINTIADRYLNSALYDVHIDPGQNFPWAVRRAYLTTHATYTTGTVSVTAAARTTATGVGTLWNTVVTGYGFNNTRVGGKMKFAGSQNIYEVSAIASDTSMTIDPNWVGDALSAVAYTYFEDEYALASDFLRPYDMRSFDLNSETPLIGPMDFRRSFPRNSLPRKPQVATIVDNIKFIGSTAPQPRVLLAPPPDKVYSIPYSYITSNLAVSSAGTAQAQMTADADEPIVPLMFRHLLVLNAAYHWYRDRKDDQRSQEVKAEYTDLIQRVVGTGNIGQDRASFRVDNSRYSATGRLGRFDTESGAFDGLRDRRWR